MRRDFKVSQRPPHCLADGPRALLNLFWYEARDGGHHYLGNAAKASLMALTTSTDTSLLKAILRRNFRCRSVHLGREIKTSIKIEIGREPLRLFLKQRTRRSNRAPLAASYPGAKSAASDREHGTDLPIEEEPRPLVGCRL